MKFNEKTFLKTELGANMTECVNAWDNALFEKSNHSIDTDEYRRACNVCLWCQAQWEIYQIAVRQFYHIEIHFSRTDEYYGICTDNEKFLYKRSY